MTKPFVVWPHCLKLFDSIWSCLAKFEIHQTSDQKAWNIAIVVVFDVWCLVRLARCIKHVWLANTRWMWSDIWNVSYIELRDALSQIPPCWNCCGILGNFVAHNSLRSDVWRYFIKHVWTVWPGLQTAKCLITKQCLGVKHSPFRQGLTVNSPHDSELRLTWSTLSFGDWKINMAERWREKTQILWTWKALHFIAVEQHFQYSKFLQNRRWWWIIKKSLQRRRKGPRSAKRKRDVWRVTVSFNCQLIYVISEQF